MTERQAAVFTEMLAVLPYFPGEAGARMAIGDEIRAMCGTPDQAVWLVTRMRRLYQRWPGTYEMRRVLCSRFAPLDGVPALGKSEAYPDGIPSDRPDALALPAARMKSLPAGSVSAAPSLNLSIADLACAKDLNSLKPVKVRDIPVVRVTAANRITQADVDRAVGESRAKRAMEELDQQQRAAGEME